MSWIELKGGFLTRKVVRIGPVWESSRIGAEQAPWCLMVCDEGPIPIYMFFDTKAEAESYREQLALETMP